MSKHINIITISLLTIFVCLIISCSDKKKEFPLNVIQVANSIGDYKILNLSDYVAEIKYIPLETNDSILIGANPKISYENGYVLIQDALNNCFLFDNNGQFCRKIGKYGQGSYEHYYISQAFIHDDLIYINDLQKLLIYDMNGCPVERINLRSSNIPVSYQGLGDGYLFPLEKDTFVMSVVSMEGYYPKAILFEASPSGAKLIKEYPNHITLDKEKRGFLGRERGFIYRFQNAVRTYKGINDTVFTIGSDKEINASYIFNIGKYSAPLSFFEFKELDSEGNMSTAMMKYIFPNTMYESLNYLFIEFYFGNYAPEAFVYKNPTRGTEATNYNVYGVFDKSKGELTLMRQPMKGKLGFKNDLDNGIIIWPTYITTNDEIVLLIQPEEFMNYYDNIDSPSTKLKSIANTIKMDDNPILIIAKLK